MSSNETVFYKDEKVLVTNSRALFGGRTYDISSINSVAICFVQPLRTWGVVLSVLSCIFAWGIGLGFSLGRDLTYNLILVLLAMLCLFVLGLGIVLATRITCVLEIRSSSGEYRAISSRDLTYIQKVAGAMHEAMARRG